MDDGWCSPSPSERAPLPPIASQGRPLTLAGLGHLLGGAFLGLKQLLDALRLAGHDGSDPDRKFLPGGPERGLQKKKKRTRRLSKARPFRPSRRLIGGDSGSAFGGRRSRAGGKILPT